jgi:DNA polymerase III sliding clamp (beta) subunit (PCNA family)
MNTYSKLKGLLSVTPKNDIRYYLNVIRVTSSELTTSNGSSAVIVEHHTSGVDSEILICRHDLATKLKLFKKNDELNITVNGDSVFLNEYKLKTVDGRYPDIKRALKNNFDDGNRNGSDEIGFDMTLMSKISTAVNMIKSDPKLPGAKYTFYGASNGCKIETGTITAYVMACRL